MHTTIFCDIQNTATGLWKGFEQAANTAAETISTGYNWAGRRVEKLSYDLLPQTAAKVVAASLWALPYTVAALLAPEFVNDIATGLSLGLWQTCPREIDEAIGKETRQRAFTGLRNASIIRAGVGVVQMTLTGNWWLLLPIISNVFFALQSNAIISQDTPEKRFMQKPEPKSTN